uniref:uncharacterized protein LOC120337764 n=1 Tax=Styela clava TaxID=7725 RepID=UPI001939C764|nr:uncharacterized protein LOC120337764 [Styela clava]
MHSCIHPFSIIVWHNCAQSGLTLSIVVQLSEMLRNRIPVIYRTLDQNYFNDVLKIIKSHYIKREPQCLALKVTENMATMVANLFLKEILSEKLSIGAFDKKTNELIAIHIVGRFMDLTEFGFDKHLSLPLRQNREITKTLFKGWSKLSDKNTKNSVQYYITCIKERYSRQSIPTEMNEQTQEIALKMGFTKICVIATNHYIQKSLKRCGFSFVNEIQYADYVDPITGKQIFKCIPFPHTFMGLAIKELATSKL